MNNEFFNLDFSDLLISGYVTSISEGSQNNIASLGVHPGFQVFSNAFQKSSSSNSKPIRPVHPQASHLFTAGSKTISEIPIVFLFSEVVANLKTRFDCFNADGVLICAGNEKVAQQEKATTHSNQTLIVELKNATCPGYENCSFPKPHETKCQLHGLMYIGINSEHFVEDDIFVFEFDGLDVYKQLYMDLSLLHALFGDLRGLPLSIKLRTQPNSIVDEPIQLCPSVGLSLGIDFEEAKASQVETMGLKGLHCSKTLNWDAWQNHRCSMLHSPVPHTGSRKVLQPIAASECSSNLL